MTRITPTFTRAWSIKGYGRAEDLSLSSLPVAHLGPGEVIVEMEAASLNQLDLKLISGDMRKFMPTSFPYVPGNDVCGRVVATGKGVEQYNVGDRIVGLTPHNGGMAQFVICAEGPTLAHAPDTPLADDLAALPETGMTAMAIMRAADLHPGDDLLIIGATGGIGLFLCQFASKAGVNVIATAASDDEHLVRSNGADETIDHTSGDTVQHLKARRPDGVRMVVDLINQGDALLGSADAVMEGGKLISPLIGPEQSQFARHVNVTYIRLSPTPGHLEQLVRSLAEGSLRSNVTKRYSFADVPEAYASLRDDHVRGKIVVSGLAS